MNYSIAMTCDWSCVRCDRTFTAAQVYRTSPYEKECRFCGTHTEWMPTTPEPEPESSVTSREMLVDMWDRSPLVAAAATGDVEWVTELLAAGDDVNEFSSAYDYSALIVAAQKGHTNVVQMLLMTGKCDLTKKHMDYINALDSALFGYTNLEGCEDEFTPEIRGLILRAFLETADAVHEQLQLQIQATGTVEADRFKPFRNVGGRRLASRFPKAVPGRLNLTAPSDAAMPAVMLAAQAAVKKLTAVVVTAGPKKKGNGAVAVSRLNAAAAVVGGAGIRVDDDDDDRVDRVVHAAEDAWLDDRHGY